MHGSMQIVWWFVVVVVVVGLIAVDSLIGGYWWVFASRHVVPVFPPFRNTFL